MFPDRGDWLGYDTLPMSSDRREAIPITSRNIRRLREKRGWSQQELADRSGLSSVKQIELGKNVGRVETLVTIANALGVTMDDLLSENDVPLPEALATFISSPQGREMAPITDAEIEQLRKVPAYGKKPVVDTYYWALKMLRSMPEDKNKSRQ